MSAGLRTVSPPCATMRSGERENCRRQRRNRGDLADTLHVHMEFIRPILTGSEYIASAIRVD